MVDRATKQATNLQSVSKSLLPSTSDLFTHINKFIRNQWFSEWKDSILHGNKLAQLKDTPVPWASSSQSSRRLGIVLTRLRIGHTRLTHTHLVTHLWPLSCPFCNTDEPPLTVDHIFECPLLLITRQTYSIPHNRPAALSDFSPSLTNIFPSLQHIGLLRSI